MQIEGADIAPVDQQLPALELVEARHQLAELDLPAPVWPTRATVSPAAMVRLKLCQHGLLVGVAEVHVLELDAPRKVAARAG